MPFHQGRRASHVREIHGTGTWAIAIACLLCHLCLVSAFAETPWTPLTGPKKMVPDASWGPSWSRGGSRLAVDGQSNVYLTLGDSLHIREAYGGVWRTVPRKGAHFFGDHSPLAVGSDGMVLWGSGSSADKGRNWSTFGPGRIGFPSALAVLPNGNALAGGSYDALDLSVDSGRTWKSVHMGRTFGSIIDIASSVDGWAWAAPQADGLLVSRDYGLNWTPADSIIGGSGSGAAGFRAQYLAPTRTDNAMYAYQHPNAGDPRILEFEWSGQAGTVKVHPLGAGFPDSTVTALEWSRIVRYDREHGLWVGTWGQGVWWSPDGGKSWVARNRGLGDLHVEAIEASSNGDIFVLTRDGLYGMTIPSPIRIARKAPQGGGTAGRAGRGMFRFGNGSEVSNPIDNIFRADGRAARLPSTEQRPAVGAP